MRLGLPSTMCYRNTDGIWLSILHLQCKLTTSGFASSELKEMRGYLKGTFGLCLLALSLVVKVEAEVFSVSLRQLLPLVMLICQLVVLFSKLQHWNVISSLSTLQRRRTVAMLFISSWVNLRTN